MPQAARKTPRTPDPKPEKSEKTEKPEKPIRIELREGRSAIASIRPIPHLPEAEEPNFEIKIDQEVLEGIIQDRQAGLIKVFTTLEQVTKDLDDFFPQVPQTLPPRVHGQLINPDGSPAKLVSVEAEEPEYSTDELPGDDLALLTWPRPRAITDERGAFNLNLPTVPVPQSGLRLSIQGGNASTEIALRRVDVLEGKLGVLDLDRPISPLPKSIVSRLLDIVATDDEDVEESPEDFADPAPQVMLGEGDCARFFRSNSGVIDRFGYSMLIRLIEPQVKPKQLVLRTRLGENYFPIRPMLDPVSDFAAMRDLNITVNRGEIVDAMRILGQLQFVDRVPVDQPIDVAEFHQAIEQFPATVPKAATLGLGYVVKMHQVWIPAGLSLGNLLYSMALAPGETQRIAIYEQVETLGIQEREALSIDEAQRFSEAADSSTLATFNSAYREAISGGSSMHTESESWGIGGAGGIGGFVSGLLFGVGAAGGYGSSSGSGSTSSWQNASRDFVSSAAQDFHSRLSRESAAKRRSARTAVRLATASEREQVTNKVIANHNHCHALTIQYWEVLRHYAVSSKVDDVQLICFIPLEIVNFLPLRQPRNLPSGSYSRDQLLARYAMLIRYHDVLSYHLQRRPDHMHGLKLLMNFASNPTMIVQSSTGLAQDVVSFSITGTFLPFEEIYVSLYTKSGGRVGPVKLIGASQPIPADQFSSADGLLQHLRDRRSSNAGETLSANLVLPDYIARSDVVRFELTRRFAPFSYKLNLGFPNIEIDFPNFLHLLGVQQVSYSSAQLEQLLGGPFVWDANAEIQGTGETYVDSFNGRAAAVLMGTNLPIPALRVPPILSFADLLRIESVFQHVVQNTVTFSKAVWTSLTPEERAILLERFTIGVPQGGVSDASQEIPLLNCVANEVLGYYGNAVLMPFHIPPQLSEEMKITSRDVQEALLKFHRQAFVPPRSSITLPTRGFLGEAILGSCDACEKIDLTRFWNWQDSPAETVEAIQPSAISGQSLVGSTGATAPSQLTAGQPASLINIATGQAAPAPSTALVEALMSKLPAPAAIPDITGLQALKDQLEKTRTSADEARKEAVGTSKELAKTAMTELSKILRKEPAKEEEKKEEENGNGEGEEGENGDGDDDGNSNGG